MNLGVRLASGLSLGGLIIWGLWCVPPAVFCLGLCVFSAYGLYEYLTMLKLRGVSVYRVFGVAMGAAIPLVVFLHGGQTESGEVLFLVLACFGLFILQLTRGDNLRSLEGVVFTFFGLMYIAWFLSFLIKLRYLAGGAAWVTFVLSVTKASDIGAYACGSLFGKKPLAPNISPKKTVEGTIAGIVISGITAVCFLPLVPAPQNVWLLAFLGVLMGVVGQCGDLAESLIKRHCQAKDAGRAIPGMGGVLDVMDSVLFTAPLFYFYLKTL